MSDSYRIVTMGGEVVGDGPTLADAMLQAADVGHDGATVTVWPGDDIGGTLATVRADLADGMTSGNGRGQR